MISIEKIREQFPALQRTHHGKPVAYFDGPGGSQVVQGVIDAMVRYMSQGGANLHGEFPSSRETEQYIEKARQAIADLVGAKPNEVAFGQNSTSLLFSIARSLSRDWSAGDNIVVTEMDHRSHVDAWVTAAADRDVEIRFLPVDEHTLTLRSSSLCDIIDERTQLVAVTLASNAIGTITNIAPIAERTCEVGALLSVDAVHAAPHFFLDRDEIGADILVCSAYKFFGPHIGMAVIRERLFQALPVYKLHPAPAYIPDKLETGTQNHEAIASLPAAVEFIAGLGSGATRREQLRQAFRFIEAHENKLADQLRYALSQLQDVTLYQAPAAVAKTPTIAFRIANTNPVEVCRWLAEQHSIFLASGDFYASTLAEKLQVHHTGGWIRAGLAPYNTEEEVQRFIAAVAEYIQTHLPSAAAQE